MNVLQKTVIIAFILLITACKRDPSAFQSFSPDESVSVKVFEVSNRIAYQIFFLDELVIDTSFIGFDFKYAQPLWENLIITNRTESKADETWEMPWGEQRVVQNKYNQLLLELSETKEKERSIKLEFKIYDDGVGFRYHFLEQEGVKEVLVMDEHTEFNLTGDHKVWWIPGDWDVYEHLYNSTKLSKIDATSKRNHPNLAATYIPENAVNTPVTMKTADGTYLSIHEADLTDYSGMTLKVDTVTLKMTSELVGAKEGHKVKRELPFSTPWRTIQLGREAGDLIASNLIVNLNDPLDSLTSISWFEPFKYVGIWWEMHLSKSEWQLAGGKHGATTENAKKHIDFAAANGIDAVLVEGWNTGWERWIDFPDREGVFDFVTPYPDYDLQEVAQYGRTNSVQLVMHHETSAAPRTYEHHMDTAFQLMRSLGIHSVKTGYVGPIIPEGERHHGQWMVNHYQRVLEMAAKHKIAINAHEPIKATGKRRTFPNAISREGLRGQEFNAWSIEGGNPPEHLTIVPFTRMLAGPIDFTPGIFDIELNSYNKKNKSRVNTTLAHQLALYVVLYSPIQMAADLIENYEGQPAFQFIREVGLDWEQSKVLGGEIGEYLVLAREERETGDWFVGGVADENGFSFSLNLDFLPEEEKYDAIIYKDAETTHWETNPQEIVIDTLIVTNQTNLDMILAPGGGFAISLLIKD